MLVPLFYQQHINQFTQLAIWKIEEDENFFLQKAKPTYSIASYQKLLQHLAAKHLLVELENDFPISEVLNNENGKPYLPNNEFYFSVSHTKNYAAVVVSTKQQVAIDIECQHQKVLQVQHKFLSNNEKLLMQKIVAETQFAELPTVLWCAKETMFKLYAKGNVDFKTMLQLQLNTLTHNEFKAAIITEKSTTLVTVNYKLLNDICLTFIAQ